MHGAEEEEGRPDPRFHYDPQYQPQTGGPMDQTSSRHSYIDLTCLSPPPLNPAPPESFPTFSREQQGPLTSWFGDGIWAEVGEGGRRSTPTPRTLAARTWLVEESPSRTVPMTT